ncbi:MAG: MaoC family dehydratase N-terminal domain-containing protein [Dehalococcoidia bacterium]
MTTGNSQQPVLTDEHRALIGVEAQPVTSPEPLERGAMRRFVQAIMDNDPVYWDEEYARQTRYGGVVVPPLAVTSVSRRRPGTPDPLDHFKVDPDWDGASPPAGRAQERPAGSLPPVLTPTLPRLLNGGVSAEFFAYGRPGDYITARQKYADITERTGRDGPMVIVVTETTYTNQDALLLCKVRQTLIRR